MATAGGVRGSLLDLAGLAAVAVLLVGIHLLVPPATREGLALQYADPDPGHAVTAAYVHLDAGHLRGNVVGYLAGSLSAYLLCLVAGERRWFRLTTGTYLVAVPILVGLSAAVLIDRPVVGRGFSAVVAAFAGFLLVAAGVVLHRAFGVDRWVAWDVVAALVLVVAAGILWSVTGTVRPRLGAVLLAGVAMTLLPVVRLGRRTGLPTDRDGRRRLAGAVATVLFVLGVVSALVVGLFPAQLVGGGGVTNVLAHYLGLVAGAVIAGWGYRYWATAPPEGPGNRRS